jgi:hypothetical protein
MKRIVESSFCRKNACNFTRSYGREVLLFKDMYVALLNNKKVLYVTKKQSDYVSEKFRTLFNIRVDCIRESENNVKLIYIKNEK